MEDLQRLPNSLPLVKVYDGLADFKTLEQRPNSEGYVISYASGLRVKIKFDEYKRLHRLVTGVNAKTIWELLKNGDSYTELLDRVPDEFYNWVKTTVRDLQAKYTEIELQAVRDFTDILRPDSATTGRKAFAASATKRTYPQLLFAMLDGKPYEAAIWKMLRPAAEKPFKMEIE